MGSSALARPSWLWIAPLTDHSGYADEARGFLRALERAGQRPAARERRWRDSDAGIPEADRAMIASQRRRTPGDPVVAVHHYIPGARFSQVDGALNVSRTMFETDSIPDAWVAHLLERDEIWVPSRHNVETFRAAGIPEGKLRIVGGTLDFDLIAPGAEPLDIGRAEGETLFLTTFDFSERKGWRTLLGAWARAFHRHDPVRLVLKTGSFDHGEEYVRARIDAFLRETHGGALDAVAPISVRTETLAPEDMPRLYAAADAFVMPSHGEGWGRPYMEALAMGLPTVASRWSGNLAFMDDATSWLIDGRLVPVPLDSDPYFGVANGHRWFEPDVDELVAALREIATDPPAARARAAGARADLINRFGPQATAARLGEAAAEVLERFGDHRTRRVVMRGSFGSNASLALVNDRTGAALEARGWQVRNRTTAGGSLGEAAIGFSHSWPPNFEPVTEGPTVMTLPWEYGAPPAEWVEKARSHADRVWVPSEYVRNGYVDCGMPPGIVEVVPNGVDLDTFTPHGPRYPLPRSAGCVFLFVGGTIWRKGIDILLRAWAEAFTVADDVLLVIKDFGTATHYAGQTREGMLRELATRADIAPIVYLEEELTPGELPALYRAADAVVLPYRGEGFCLPALEAMACGRPVVHNGVGPTSEFVPEYGGWALPARRLETDGRGLPELAGPCTVHEVEHDALVRALREVAARPEERAARGRICRAAAQSYGWTDVAARAEALLTELAAEGLPFARDIVAADVDGHETVVLFAPDWSRAEDWAGPLREWVEHVRADDPVTLALHVGDMSPDGVALEVIEMLVAAGHDEQALPDLAVCDVGGAAVHGLVARADAVLLSESSARRPDIRRRSQRLLNPDAGEVRAYAAELRPNAALLPA